MALFAGLLLVYCWLVSDFGREGDGGASDNDFTLLLVLVSFGKRDIALGELVLRSCPAAAAHAPQHHVAHPDEATKDEDVQQKAHDGEEDRIARHELLALVGELIVVLAHAVHRGQGTLGLGAEARLVILAELVELGVEITVAVVPLAPLLLG